MLSSAGHTVHAMAARIVAHCVNGGGNARAKPSAAQKTVDLIGHCKALARSLYAPWVVTVLGE